MHKSQLKTLVETTNIRVFGQVLKAKENSILYNWVYLETSYMPAETSLRERVFNILNDFPNTTCSKGKTKKFIDLVTGYGYCGNAKSCRCLAEKTAELAKTNDMASIVEKRKITWLEKYGADNPSKNQVIMQQTQETKKKKNYQATYRRLQQEKQDAGFVQVIDRVKEFVRPAFGREDYVGCFRKNFYRWECIKCGTLFEDHIDYGRMPRCTKCNPRTTSVGEEQLKSFLRELGVDFLENNKKILGGNELDIYIPAQSLAIEYNGVYWHSTKHKKPTYHVEKYLQCKEKGIHLIQIFEDEWNNKQEIVKSRLKSLLGKSTKLYARKCTITEVTPQEYKKFVEQHHLQGWASASFLYGLTHNNQLVAVMSFARSRYHLTGYELIRFCSAGNVIGGASKLFNHFIKIHSPTQVVSYANRCWSNGVLYTKLGFCDVTQNIKNTGYWYVKDGKRYHRSTFTKKRLVNLFGPTSLTESKIMDQQGFLKIYDCGNYKFIWSK